METLHSLWPQKVTGSLEVEVTYFMTPKVMVTPTNHGVIRGRRDLLNYPNGHGDLCGRFDLVYDPLMSRGH